MVPRQNLDQTLRTKMPTTNIYFQPTETVKLRYPCIIYTLADINSTYADNVNYRNKKRYTVTYIDRNPDAIMYEALLEIPYSSFDRFYTADGLNHYVFTIFY